MAVLTPGDATNTSGHSNEDESAKTFEIPHQATSQSDLGIVDVASSPSNIIITFKQNEIAQNRAIAGVMKLYRVDLLKNPYEENKLELQG
eukprot:scaffold224353_cov17-Prasinocladus_malaysianus.AAC.1